MPALDTFTARVCGGEIIPIAGCEGCNYDRPRNLTPGAPSICTARPFEAVRCHADGTVIRADKCRGCDDHRWMRDGVGKCDFDNERALAEQRREEHGIDAWRQA